MMQNVNSQIEMRVFGINTTWLPDREVGLRIKNNKIGQTVDRPHFGLIPVKTSQFCEKGAL